MAGYSDLMSQDEVGAVRSLTARREFKDRLFAEYGGRIVNTAGGSIWVRHRAPSAGALNP
jgi:adenylate cyclase